MVTVDPASIDVDLSACAREPITRLDAIQSFGFLLGISTDWTIVRASANLESFLGVAPSRAVGVKLDTLIQPGTLHDIRNRMSFLNITKGVERLYGVILDAGRPPFDIAVHYSEAVLILEGEPSAGNDRTDPVSLVRAMMGRLSTSTDFDAFHDAAVRQISSMTGFGRVMLYRFDAEGAGEVIAEALGRGMDSYLGLHYPASDIPPQARSLYLKNAFRIIADVDSAVMPVLPHAAGPVKPLDLTQAMTRAVSPVHLEYLRNMKVAASMSISIVVEGKLWGLIACHHATPRLPGFLVRTASELFGQLYSLTLENWLRRTSAELDYGSRSKVDRMIMSIAGNITLLTNARWLQAGLKTLIDCDGVATFTDDTLSFSGSVPGREDLVLIIDRLKALAAGGIYITDHLAKFVPAATTSPGVAAGFLVVPISRIPRDYILVFRRQLVHDITWAGDPRKPASPAGDDARISPRKSFEAYIETVQGRSRAFTAQEIRTAEAVRAGLIEVILQFASSVDTERKRAAQRQEVLIAELNHRVRNILALIRGLISQTNVDHGDLTVAGYVASLNGRVQAIARAHDEVTRHNWEPGSLLSLFKWEMAVYDNRGQTRFKMEGPDVMLQPLALSTMSLVIHELVTNAVKYGALATDGHIAVTFERRTGEGARVGWREIGGPAVTAPTRRGFGSVIIERIVPFDLQGTVDIRYLAGGLEVDLFIPEFHLAAGTAEPPALVPLHDFSGIEWNASKASTDSPRLQGLKVLLLEDNMIVAMEGERILRELGAGTVLVASSIQGAAGLIQEQVFDLAILDINIGTQTSLGFSDAVATAGIPFVFASGYGENADVPERKKGLIVSKPYTRESLGAAASAALDAKRQTGRC